MQVCYVHGIDYLIGITEKGSSVDCCNPESAGSQAKLDRMCVHAGDGQTYLVRVDSMS